MQGVSQGLEGLRHEFGAHTRHDAQCIEQLHERMGAMHVENQKTLGAVLDDVKATRTMNTEQTEMLQALVNAKRVTVGAGRTLAWLAKNAGKLVMWAGGIAAALLALKQCGLL